MSAHRKAILQALFVTMLWSTSWVLIKFGLKDVPALTFAGLRYTLAALCLLPFFFWRGGSQVLRGLDRRAWLRLLILGLFYYTFAQGAQFLAMDRLPVVSVNSLISMAPIVTAVLGVFLLAEKPGLLQWLGVVLSVLGGLIYFYPVQFSMGQLWGVFFSVVSLSSTAVGSVLGRAVNRKGSMSPLAVTSISMAIGAPLMLAMGLSSEGWPHLTLSALLIIVYLAVVNTAFAFTLWNVTLVTLSATESSVINNAMMI